MSEYRIAITLKDNAAIPVPANQQLRIGDTVVYVTDPPDLLFRVEFAVSPSAQQTVTSSTSEFAASPFEDQTITSSTRNQVIHEGKFECRCFITPKNREEVGWRHDAPESGGEHDVKP